MTPERVGLAGDEKFHDASVINVQQHLHTEGRVRAHLQHEVQHVETRERRHEDAGSGVVTTSVVELNVVEEDDGILQDRHLVSQTDEETNMTGSWRKKKEKKKGDIKKIGELVSRLILIFCQV